MLLKQGKTIKDIWRLLKETKEICRSVKEEWKCISYEKFRRKAKKVAKNKKLGWKEFLNFCQSRHTEM